LAEFIIIEGLWDYNIKKKNQEVDALHKSHPVEINGMEKKIQSLEAMIKFMLKQ